MRDKYWSAGANYSRVGSWGDQGIYPLSIEAGETKSFTLNTLVFNAFKIFPDSNPTLPIDQVVISWQPSSYSEVAAYEVIWRNKDIRFSERVPASATSYRITKNLVSGSCYQFYVAIYDVNGALLGYGRTYPPYGSYTGFESYYFCVK